jgi:hypothetical protein
VQPVVSPLMGLLQDFRRLHRLLPVFFAIAVKTVFVWVISVYVTDVTADTFHWLLSNPWLMVQFTTIAFAMSVSVYNKASKVNDDVIRLLYRLDEMWCKGYPFQGDRNKAVTIVANALGLTVADNSRSARETDGSSCSDEEGEPECGGASTGCELNSKVGFEVERNVEELAQRRRRLGWCPRKSDYTGRAAKSMISDLNKAATDTSPLFMAWLVAATKRSRLPWLLVACSTRYVDTYCTLLQFDEMSTSLVKTFDGCATWTPELTSEFSAVLRELQCVIYSDGASHNESLVGITLMAYFVYMPLYFVLVMGPLAVIPVLCVALLVLTPFSLSRVMRAPLESLTRNDELVLFNQTLSPEYGFIVAVVSFFTCGVVFGGRRNRNMFQI